MDASPPSPEKERASLARTALAAAGVGLCELAWVHRVEGPFGDGSPWAAVLAVALAYGLGGAALAAAARGAGRLGLAALGRPSAELPLALAAPLGAHLLAWQWSHWSSNGMRALELGAALAACLALAALFSAALRSAPTLAPAKPWLVVVLAAGLYLALQPQVSRSSGAGRAERAAGPSALLVTIDTLRADGIGAYGHAAARTPTIDALAAEGVLFENAITHSVLTGPSHMSILSGLLPMEHGVIENAQHLPHDVPTLGELLASEGWATAAFVGGFPVTNRASALPGRFGEWDDDLRSSRRVPSLAWNVAAGRLARVVLESAGRNPFPHWRHADRVTDSAVAWLERASGPFFAWVHYFDPHLPYEPPEELVPEAARRFGGPRGEGWYKLSAEERASVIQDRAAVERMRQLYDAEIANVDRELARLIAAARARAQDDLWIVVTADHGESFGEHGIWYRRELYDPSLHVPLIIRPPASEAARVRPGTRVAEQVRLTDLARTLLEALGARSEVGGQGVSLLPLARGAGGPAPGPAISAVFNSRADPYQRSMISVRDGGLKAIWRSTGWVNSDALWAGERRELYDLARDPLEQHDLSAEQPETWKRLREVASEMPLDLRSPERLSEEDLKSLRSLGYTP